MGSCGEENWGFLKTGEIWNNPTVFPLRSGQPGEEGGMPRLPTVSSSPSSFHLSGSHYLSPAEDQGGNLFSFLSPLWCTLFHHYRVLTLYYWRVKQGKQDSGREEEFLCFCCGDTDRKAGRTEKHSQQLLEGRGSPRPVELGSCPSRTVHVLLTHTFLFSSCKHLSCPSNYFLDRFG